MKTKQPVYTLPLEAPDAEEIARARAGIAESHPLWIREERDGEDVILSWTFPAPENPCATDGCTYPVAGDGSLCYLCKAAAKAQALRPERICDRCSEPIPPGRKRGARYCSPECQRADVVARRTARRRAMKAAA